MVAQQALVDVTKQDFTAFTQHHIFKNWAGGTLYLHNLCHLFSRV